MRVIQPREVAGCLAVDQSGRADPANAAVLPPERVALDTRGQREHPPTAEHATFCTRERLAGVHSVLRGAFHMLISREREYLDCVPEGLEFTVIGLETG
jgi:hypothetical protein